MITSWIKKFYTTIFFNVWYWYNFSRTIVRLLIIFKFWPQRTPGSYWWSKQVNFVKSFRKFKSLKVYKSVLLWRFIRGSINQRGCDGPECKITLWRFQRKFSFIKKSKVFYQCFINSLEKVFAFNSCLDVKNWLVRHQNLSLKFLKIGKCRYCTFREARACNFAEKFP